ncbi:MAG: hypothetical protein VYD19_00590 [Myxococcota bacterium]|nr:hypothetical protein [Myxococcota bacterium]
MRSRLRVSGLCPFTLAQRCAFTLFLMLSFGLRVGQSQEVAETSDSLSDAELSAFVEWSQLALRGARALSQEEGSQRGAGGESSGGIEGLLTRLPERDRAKLRLLLRSGVGQLALYLGGGEFLALGAALYSDSLLSRILNGRAQRAQTEPITQALRLIESRTLEGEARLFDALEDLSQGQRALALGRLRAGLRCVENAEHWPDEDEQRLRLMACVSPLEESFSQRLLLTPSQRLYSATLLVELYRSLGAIAAAERLRLEALSIPSQRALVASLWAELCASTAPHFRERRAGDRIEEGAPQPLRTCAAQASWLSESYHHALRQLPVESEDELREIEMLRARLAAPLSKRPSLQLEDGRRTLLKPIHASLERSRALTRALYQNLRVSFVFDDHEPLSRDDFRYQIRCDRAGMLGAREVIFERRGALAVRRRESSLFADLKLPPLRLRGPAHCTLSVSEKDYMSPSDQVGTLSWTLSEGDQLSVRLPAKAERLSVAGRQPRFACRHEGNDKLTVQLCVRSAMLRHTKP